MRSEFEVAFNEIAELRSLPRETVLEALRTALISAYRRDAAVGASQRVEANIDPGTGRARIMVEKEVVESVQDSRTEVELEKARYYDPEANLGDMVMVQAEGTTKKFGRIAAQTAKQVILQKIREAERNSLFDEFVEREGDLVTGTVQSFNSNVVTLSLGRAEAIMPRNQQIPGEKYKQHEKVRSYIVEVKKSSRGPQIIVSRSHRNMLRRLLEYEVPEIYNGQVEIKSIAREAGQRSKVAVAALQDGIDPVGACVGMRGIRIQNIVKELHDEKIDVIEWNTKSEVFIEKALSPARVSGVYLEEDPDSGRTAVVIVPDDQLSLAIGREGQNARLAAKLTGWRIDIKSVTEAVQEALENINSPTMRSLSVEHAETLVEIQRILDKRASNRAVMPEEYQTLSRFADVIQRRLMAAREVARQARVAEINAVKSTLPPAAFQTPVTALDVPKEIHEALQSLENVGEIMWRFLIDEKRLRQMLSDCPSDSLSKLQAALDKLVLPEYDAGAGQPLVEAAPAVEEAADSVVQQVGEEVVPEAFADEPFVPGKPVRKPEPSPQQQPATPVPAAAAAAVSEEPFGDEDTDMDLLMTKEKPGKKKTKERDQRRQLIFDDDRGEMVVKRRRKGGRGQGEWEEWEE